MIRNQNQPRNSKEDKMETTKKQSVSLMSRYYEYSKILSPKISDPQDRESLNHAQEIMKKVLSVQYFLEEKVIFGDADRVIVEDLTGHISQWEKEAKKCKAFARKCKFVGHFKNYLVFPHSGDRLIAEAKKYDQMIKDYQQAINQSQQTINQVKERIQNRNGKIDLVNRVLSGNILEYEKMQFGSYLREHHLSLSSEEIKQYSENPEHLIFDTILVLRDKYDPRGAF